MKREKFILKLKFEKVDINNYEYKYTDCSNNHNVTPKKHRITFDYFEYEDIPLIVEANKIKADVMVSPTGHPSSIGLQRDNTVNIGNGTDYTVNGLAKITMSWSDTPGKF